ncbi:unnamed protein product [Allacma fusca]|uniref:Uncharacterized protein n=1 Tax=Allacma fusca TaxID=39272 RepID=A0A8J2P4E0_9HEXA|nr:unnamed protein product [Allacma fusca]
MTFLENLLRTYGTFEFSRYIKYPVIGIQAIIILCYLTTWFTNQSIYCNPGIEFGPKKGKYTTTSRLCLAQDFILNYRALQVLHAKANQIAWDGSPNICGKRIFASCEISYPYNYLRRRSLVRGSWHDASDLPKCIKRNIGSTHVLNILGFVSLACD